MLSASALAGGNLQYNQRIDYTFDCGKIGI